jgi:tetratricopeptide (TPR) repeat protein
MRRLLLYLIAIAEITLIFTGPGCRSVTPVIELQPPEAGNFKAFGKYADYRIDAGDFTTARRQNSHYGEFVREYLAQKLTEIQNLSHKDPLAADATVSRKPAVIDGHIDFIRNADPVEAIEEIIDINITFKITRQGAGSTMASTQINKKSPREEKSIQAKLRESVDSFLAEIYPDQTVIPIKMVKGRGKYNRRGRELAAGHDYAGALICFRKAIDARPDDHTNLYNAGLMCEVLSDYNCARQYYQRARELSQRDEYKAACNRTMHRINFQ